MNDGQERSMPGLKWACCRSTFHFDQTAAHVLGSGRERANAPAHGMCGSVPPRTRAPTHRESLPPAASHPPAQSHGAPPARLSCTGLPPPHSAGPPTRKAVPPCIQPVSPLGRAHSTTQCPALVGLTDLTGAQPTALAAQPVQQPALHPGCRVRPTVPLAATQQKFCRSGGVTLVYRVARPLLEKGS